VLIFEVVINFALPMFLSWILRGQSWVYQIVPNHRMNNISLSMGYQLMGQRFTDCRSHATI
jgi:hypothetical protein